MPRGLVVASWAVLLLLGVGALLYRNPRTPAGGSPAADPAAAETFARLTRPRGAATPPPPAPRDAASLTPEVEAALVALLAITPQSDPIAVSDAITALARALCVEGGGHQAILARALRPGAGSDRAVRAVLLALGRCGREDVLRALVAELSDPAASVPVRTSIVLALAQPRRAEPGSETGVVASGFGDATVSGPIRERFVLDALLGSLGEAVEAVESSRRTRDRSMRAFEYQIACLQALAGSAGDADDVLDALLAWTRKDPSMRSGVFSSLSAATPGPRITSFARPLVEDPASEEGTLQAALGLWMRGDRTTATDYVLSQLASDDVPDARKAILIHHSFGFGTSDGPAVHDLERLTLAAVSWAREHPKVVTRYEHDVGPPGTPSTPVELDMAVVADGLLSNAYSASQGRSDVLRKPTADTFVERLSRTSTAGAHRRPPGWLPHRFEGDDDYLLLVLRGLRDAPLADDTLLDVADVLTAPRPGRPPRSADVLAAITPITDRLSPAQRDQLAARRKEPSGR